MMKKPLIHFMLGSIMTVLVIDAVKSKRLKKMLLNIKNMKMPM